jgi:hypothetical protein
MTAKDPVAKGVAVATEAEKELHLITHLADCIREGNWADQRLYLLRHLERLRVCLAASPLPQGDDPLVAEIEAGLEGTTPGDWRSVDGILPPDDEGHERSFIRPVISEGYQIAQTVGPNGPANSAHIARCSPENIRKLIALIRSLSEANAALSAEVETQRESKKYAQRCCETSEASLSAANAEIERLKGALEPFAKAASPFDHLTDDGAIVNVRLAVRLGDLRRARSALADKEAEQGGGK